MVRLRNQVASIARWDAKVDPGPPLAVWICVPELPLSLNDWSRQHWRVRHRMVTNATNSLIILAKVFKIPRFERAEVQMVYYFPTLIKRDPDNYTGKAILDGLRKAGIIAEDNSTVLKLPQPVFKADRHAFRTEIWIREW